MTMTPLDPRRSADHAPGRLDDIAESAETLVRDGIVGLRGAFSRAWAEQRREDMMTAFWDAIQRPGGTIGRGPRRWYVEIHPQEFRGFVDLVTHPWVVGVSRAVLGPDYQIVEIDFDVPFQGAKNQPWHRDFPSPRESYEGRRITSLAFNLIGVRKHPQMGDVSCRSALTIHRGTAHGSPIARPVLVLGVDAPGAGHDALHDLMVTQDYHDALPRSVRDHLVCRVADKLVPVTQKHTIEGLVMGVD